MVDVQLMELRDAARDFIDGFGKGVWMVLIHTEYRVKDASKEARTRVVCSEDVDGGNGAGKG